MSALPKTPLAKCTRTVVVDLLFMHKFSLTHSQMQVMYYLLMLKNWVTFIDEGYYVILSSKIEKDLQLNPKTVEASITQLKKLNLIQTKRCKVEKWSKHRTYRRIAITSLGKEYALSHYKESDYQKALLLEQANEAFRVKNSSIEQKNIEIDTQNRELQLQNSVLTLQMESEEEIAQKAIKALEEKRELEDTVLLQAQEIKKLKKEIAMQSTPKEPTPKEQKEKEENIDLFRKKGHYLPYRNA